MRFRQHHEAGDSPGSGKFMPCRLAQRMQGKFLNQTTKKVLQLRQVLKRRGVTTMRLYNPFTSAG